MPNAVTFGAGQRTLSYGHDANGEKHSVAHTSSSGTSVTEYCDNVIYRNGSPAILLTEIGYYSFADGRYHTYIRDWQGNNRVVLRDDGLVEELNDYYASGCRIGGADKGVQPYKYSGKELDTFGDLNWYDFGARHYDPVLMRWTTTDPLAEKYYGVSPYAFCDNDPVNFVDPDGERLYFAKDVSDKFKKQFAETIKFMNSKGTSGDIARLHSSETVYYIGEASRGKEHWNHFNLHTRTILWDPNTIYESPENMFVSPATTLAHEVSHALRYDTAMNSDDPDVKANYIRALQSDSANKYGSQEEEIVITTTEQSAARKHGEIRKDQVTRKGHTSGKLISIGSDMSPEDLSKSIFEHNNLF